MGVVLMEGKKVSEEFRNNLEKIIMERKLTPGLATVLVGEDPASQVYVRNKIKACEKMGIYSDHHKLSADVSEKELLDLIAGLNSDPKINGILVQLPLPKGINADKIINSISPEKDVDCFHPVNVGKFYIAKTWKEMEALRFLPCTPYGIMEILKYYKVEIQAKKVVVIGRSNIVGKPIGMMLMANNATVSYCHSKTDNLPKVAAEADILVAAIGRARFVMEDFVKKGAVVIDVGMNRAENGLAGDVDFESVSKKASLITPVPGGVGPMTITMLLRNTVNAVLKEKVM